MLRSLAARIRREIRHMWLCHTMLHGGMAAIVAAVIVIENHGGILIPGLFAMLFGAFLSRNQHLNPKCPKWDDAEEPVTQRASRRGRLRQYQGPARLPASRIGINAVHAVYCWPALTFGVCIAVAVIQFLVGDVVPFLLSFAPIVAVPLVIGALLPDRHRNDSCPRAARSQESPPNREHH